jgi:integrase
MPRAVKDAKLDSRAARAKLKASGKPYWRQIDPELHLGYRKGKVGGKWVRRRYLGGQHYQVETIGIADDHADADGVKVLDWRQAQAKARERPAESEDTPLTVAQAVDEYVADLRARKGDKAAREVEGRLQKHLLPTLGDRALADLTAGDLTRWRNGMVDGGEDEDQIRASRDSANRVLNMAKAAFNLAFNGSRVADDRAWRRVKAFRDVAEARKVILSEDQLQRLIDACEPGLRELVTAGAMTGARLGELTARRVRDFDPDAAAITVVYGKTRSREVHLPSQAITLFRQMASGKRPDGHLFATATGARWTASLHARPFAAAIKKAGLDPKTTFYSLRHTYISRALVAGVPTKAVADHCGTSVAMIEQYYAKFIPSDMRRYAALAAPAVRVDADQKVRALRPAG